jgi:hypothetical protein
MTSNFSLRNIIQFLTLNTVTLHHALTASLRSTFAFKCVNWINFTTLIVVHRIWWATAQGQLRLLLWGEMYRPVPAVTEYSVITRELQLPNWTRCVLVGSDSYGDFRHNQGIAVTKLNVRLTGWLRQILEFSVITRVLQIPIWTRDVLPDSGNYRGFRHNPGLAVTNLNERCTAWLR